MAKKETKEKTADFILIDQSQSMTGKWSEALSSVNSYVEGINKATPNSKITVVTFDSMGFNIIRDGVKAKDFKAVTNEDAKPRGMTPLYDSLAKLVQLAVKENAKKTVIVVMTDGEENCSKEITTKEGAANIIKGCQDKNWQVVFLGADFDAFGQANSVGVSAGQTMVMTRGNYDVTMNTLAASRSMYVASGTDISFSDKDRNAAKGKL